MRIAFGLVILLNAFLLFLIQPMVAKALLPIFGGAPSVWLVSMVFFQGVLLIGYGYGHLVSKLPIKVQAVTHFALFAFSWLSIPLGARIIGSALNPAMGVLLSLAATIGPAYALISPNSPLLQKWYAATPEGQKHRPYFLYSASNVGSLIGLLCYPFVIEPRLTLHDQFQFFQYGFAIVAVGLGIAAALVAAQSKLVVPVEDAEPVAPTAWRDRLWWIAYSAVPSGLMVAVTSNLTYNIAPIPLLWVLPLSLYLVTFVLAFSTTVKISSAVLGRIYPLLATPLLIPIILESGEIVLIAFHLAVFFCAAWMCHKKLAESAPDAKHATEFYFFLALGGVIGSAIVSLFFPLLAKTYIEYPLFIAAAGFLIPQILRKPLDKLDFIIPVVVFGLELLVVAITNVLHVTGKPMIMICVGVPAILAFASSARPVRYGLSMIAVIAGASITGIAIGGRILRMDRSFFGVHRVVTYHYKSEDPNEKKPRHEIYFHQLVHGNTVHGRQLLDRPTEPQTYYHPTGPIGLVFEKYGSQFKNVALVGLGVGSLSAYGRPGMNMTFFEIDPSVIALAQDPKLFTYVRDSKASKLQIIQGDGRQELAKTSGPYDLIVLDAFSSDSIPTHLMTMEALDMYLSKLAPHGLIAYHTSNRYLSLKELVAAMAHKKGLKLRYEMDAISDEDTKVYPGKTSAEWIIVGREDADLKLLPGYDFESTLDDMGVRPWTDDYSNLLEALLRRQREGG